MPLSGQSITDTRRLQALHRSGLMSPLPEPQFDRITRLVSRLFGVPVALLSMVDADHQYFKSACGLPEPAATDRRTPLSHSFCKHVVISNQPLVVSDAREDPRVRDNLAIPELGVISYLGVPVHAPEGDVLGSLCAIGTEPREWRPDDVALMHELAAMVESELVLRDKAQQLGVLAREYHHRVKNALAVASSLVTISGRDAGSVQEAVSTAQGRLMALSSAHDTLMSESDDVDLADLAQRLLQPYCQPGALADVDGPVVTLRQAQVTPICLLLHELATNSAKYGAFHADGEVRLRWQVSASEVSLLWQETSVRIEGGRTEGFGSQLTRIAIMQLGGTLMPIWRDGELRVEIAFPLREVEGAA